MLVSPIIRHNDISIKLNVGTDSVKVRRIEKLVMDLKIGSTISP